MYLYIGSVSELDVSRGTIYPFNRVKKLNWVRSYFPLLFFFIPYAANPAATDGRGFAR